MVYSQENPVAETVDYPLLVFDFAFELTFRIPALFMVRIQVPHQVITLFKKVNAQRPAPTNAVSHQFKGGVGRAGLRLMSQSNR